MKRTALRLPFRPQRRAGYVGRLAEVIRAPSWLEYKLAPLVGLMFAIALSRDAALLPLLPDVAVLLIAIAACAAFVSILNDYTDIESDRIAGKVNRMAGRSTRTVALLFMAPIAVAALPIWLWRAKPAVLLAYAASWLVFLAYSAPPVRLKARGLSGLAADAAGAHLFPSLTAALVTMDLIGAPAGPWLLATLLWAFAWGLRGILSHQLRDAEADRAAGVRTFVTGWTPDFARKVGECVLFPIECVAAAAMLFLLHAWIALGAFALSLAAPIARGLGPGSWFRILSDQHGLPLLYEFYLFWFAVAVIVQAGLSAPADLLLLLLPLGLFRRRARWIGGKVWRWATARALAAP